jgi:hypothetical protein
MSAHYSKYDLNSYKSTPYLAANLPEGYPLSGVLIKSRAFRRLPPNLRELCGLAKQWAVKNWGEPAGIVGIEQWYDDEGYELNHNTGKRLTDKEIDRDWDSIPLAPAINSFKVKDIPIPDGGFADPDTWEESQLEGEKSDDGDRMTEADILRDISLRGREYTARYYGVPIKHKDEELARAILAKMGGG